MTVLYRASCIFFSSICWAITAGLCVAQSPLPRSVTIIAGFHATGHDQPVKQSNREAGNVLQVEKGLAQMVRLYTRHLYRFLPGDVKVATKYMPGGGGMRPARFVAASRPGHKAKLFLVAMPVHAISKHILNVQHNDDLFRELVPLSAMAIRASFCASRLGLNPAEIRNKRDRVIFGSAVPGSRSRVHLRAFMALTDIRMKVVSGYTNSAAVAVAVLRGEVDGMCGWSFSAYQSVAPRLIASGRLRPLLRIAPEEEKKFSHIPGASQIARRSKQADLIGATKFLEAEATLPFVLFVPASYSQARQLLLDGALQSMFRDKKFRQEANGRGLPVRPVAREKIQNALRVMRRTSKDAKKLVRQWYGH